MGNDASRTSAYLAAILIGLLPAWMILLPLDMISAPTGWLIFVRTHSLAVPLAQLIFVLLAMGITFSPLRSVSQLPRLSKAALSLWILVAGYVSFQAENDDLLAAIGFLKLFVAALFLLALVELRKTRDLGFLQILWISIGLGVLIYIILWAINITIVTPRGDDWVYGIPGVNNVRHTGHFALAGVIAGLFILIALRENKNAWLRWALPLSFSSAGLGLALWTGSRGPLLASLITMLVTFAIVTRSRKTIAIFCLASALAATSVVALLPVPHPIYGIAGATGMADVSDEGMRDPSSGRTELWSATIEKISQRPLLGWGVNQFLVSGPSKPVSFLHPHNFPLQLIFSGGIVSLLLSLFIVFPILRLWKWPYINGPSAAGVGGVVGILAYSLYDGSLYFSYPTTIFLVAIASSIAPAAEQRDLDRSG